MKIIFLDIDGVLNCQNGYEEGFCRYNDDYGQDFYPPSSYYLNSLIKETGAKIVISSTWRMSGLKIMQEMWKHREMEGDVIDITPSFLNYKENFYHDSSFPRGLEIDQWLYQKGFSEVMDFMSSKRQLEYIEQSEIENYVIIDDDADMLYKQRHNFVHVKAYPLNYNGFNKSHYNKALEILSKSYIENHENANN